MRITKLGHCCLLIETQNARILTDPGGWSEFLQDSLENIDIVLITHEHPDHLHIGSLQNILRNNPKAIVITNSSVGKILKSERISFETIEKNQSNIFHGTFIQGFGNEHQEIYGNYGLVQNTGYFIDNNFFYPGDAFTNPGKKVNILALPVCGPWTDIKRAIDYAKLLNPNYCFPVHDGMLQYYSGFHKHPEIMLTAVGIHFKALLPQESWIIDR